jgi:hypothetical protein
MYELYMNERGDTNSGCNTQEVLVQLPFTEMATVGRVQDPKGNFIVVVTPDSGQNDSYIKVLNSDSYTKADKIIRLAFTKEEYYDHKGDGKELWKISNSDIRRVTKWLRSTSKTKIEHGSLVFDTNWKQAIYHWNNECGFLNHPDFDETIPEGCAENSRLRKNPQYVPLNTEIPDWTKIKL